MWDPCRIETLTMTELGKSIKPKNSHKDVVVLFCDLLRDRGKICKMYFVASHIAWICSWEQLKGFPQLVETEEIHLIWWLSSECQIYAKNICVPILTCKNQPQYNHAIMHIIIHLSIF